MHKIVLRSESENSEQTMEISFNGKRALVTGAGQGIGREVCKKLRECGAHVVALSKTLQNLETLQQELPDIGIIHVDLEDWNATKKAVEDAGPFQLLVNNAGIGLLASFLETTPEMLDKTLNINFKSMVNVSQVVVKELIKNKESGSIVNVSSIASTSGLSQHTAYSASKAAMDAVSKVMALELGQYKIRVNCINPTVVLTEMGRTNWQDPVKLNPLLNRIPLGRLPEVEEVVDAILFLLSDKASMVNGVTLPIEGGLSCVGIQVPNAKS